MIETRNLIAKIATNNDEIEACKRLRHRIFLRALNEGIGDSEQGIKLDEDIYDSLAEHIILIDRKRLCKGLNNYAVGTCRLIVGSASDGPNHFYSNSEFVIDSLVKSFRGLVNWSFGCSIFLPLEVPAIILIYQLLYSQYLFEKNLLSN